MKKWLRADMVAFLSKIIGIYIVWYVLYDLWLLPEGRLDAWVVHNIISVCAGWLHYFQYPVYWSGRLIGLNGAPGILLVNGCSGLSAMGLYAGFIIAYPGRWIPRLCFIIVGVGFIYLLNIARICTLVLTQKYWASAFNITHHYSTTAIFYLAIFVLWMIWVNAGAGQLSAVSQPKNCGLI